MHMVENVSSLIPWLIAAAILGLVFWGVNAVARRIRRLKNTLTHSAEAAILRELSPYAKEIVSGVMEAATDDTPKVRSTGGCTAMCLAKVQRDFEDFHPDDAQKDIQTCMLEFLQIKYCGQQKFEKAKVSDRVSIHVGDTAKSGLHDVKINQIAISDYQKSLNSATLKYRVSVGFMLNGTRKEKLYEISYTLQLRDEYDASAFLKCENCGAPLPESDGVCPYCGMKHIRDTISNWVVTDILEK